MATKKKVNYEPIERTNEAYEMLDKLVKAHHQRLMTAKIALVWRKEANPNADGKIELGKAKKASDIDKQLKPFDFVIVLNKDMWQNHLNWDQCLAVLDHELVHCEIVRTPNGQLKEDEDGRLITRIRKHDLEEFREIVLRHGLYLSDIEDFAQACARAKSEKKAAAQ